MLAGGQAQSAAKATKIVSGLAGVKTAVLTWYRENTDKIDNDGKIDGTEPSSYFTADKIKKYLNVGNDFTIGTSGGNYEVKLIDNNDSKPTWYVCYYLEDKPDKNDIIARLADKALAQSGDLWQKNGSWRNYSTDVTSGNDDIYMEILIFNY